MSNLKITKLDRRVAALLGITTAQAKQFRKAFRLTILNDLLESQLQDDQIDTIEYDDFLLAINDDNSVDILPSLSLNDMFIKTTRDGHDYLGESIIEKFTQTTTESYNYDSIIALNSDDESGDNDE